MCVTLLSGVSLWASYCWNAYADGFRAVPPVLVAIGGAWLAFCWQRRVAFTKALFDIWQKIVVTVQDAIQYTHLTAPQQPDFAKVTHALSCRIDDIRGAFRNVGERNVGMTTQKRQFVLAIKDASALSDCAQRLATRPPSRGNIGVYPFESLKQILHVIELLGFRQSFTSANATVARATILALWQVLRSELLQELDRDFPEHPDTPFLLGQ